MTTEPVKHMIRFPGDIYPKLRKIAEKEERSINWEVITAVKLLIEKYEQEHGPLNVEPQTPIAQRSRADVPLSAHLFSN